MRCKRRAKTHAPEREPLAFMIQNKSYIGIILLALLLTGGNMASAQPKTPRGVQPTYVSDTTIVLCKKSPVIKNTYEIRLVLFFAVNGKKNFELRVPINANVDGQLSALITQQGGKILKQDCSDFTVSVTHFDKDGKERDSWVVGDNHAWGSLIQSLHSPWLKSELKPNASFSRESLLRLEQELSKERISLKNIDNENIQEAMQRIVQECKVEGGYVLVQ
jgi:hypothetical protein